MGTSNLTPEAEEKVRQPHLLPDPNICRTMIVGKFTPFPACLVEKSMACPFAFVIGEARRCTHPNGRAFIEA